MYVAYLHICSLQEMQIDITYTHTYESQELFKGI